MARSCAGERSSAGVGGLTTGRVSGQLLTQLLVAVRVAPGAAPQRPGIGEPSAGTGPPRRGHSWAGGRQQREEEEEEGEEEAARGAHGIAGPPLRRGRLIAARHGTARPAHRGAARLGAARRSIARHGSAPRQLRPSPCPTARTPRLPTPLPARCHPSRGAHLQSGRGARPVEQRLAELDGARAGRVRPPEDPALAQTPKSALGAAPREPFQLLQTSHPWGAHAAPYGDVHGAAGVAPGWLWAQLPPGPIPAPCCPEALAGAQRYGAAPAQLSLSVTLPMTVPRWAQSVRRDTNGAIGGDIKPYGVWIHPLASQQHPTHGPEPRPRCSGEGLVPGTDGPQHQRSPLRMAGPIPALLPSASTQRPHGGHQGGGTGGAAGTPSTSISIPPGLAGLRG